MTVLTNSTKASKSESEAYENKIINRLSIVGIVGNIFLSAFKFIAGFVGNSSALISDAIHSLSDVVATFVALIGTKLAHQQADTEHPYGHERFECVASLILGLILLVTAIGIGWNAILVIVDGTYETQELPHMIALIAAIASIVIKEAMFWYTRHYALVIGSSAFMADAWHHRSDAISSVGALIGVGGSMLGFPIMDTIASIAIALLIMKVAFDIIREALSKMVDTSSSPEFEDELREHINANANIARIDTLNTRQFGNKVYVDLEIALDGNISLYEAHKIAEDVEGSLEDAYPTIKHVMVHVNPL